jgi:hypothetical protein
MALSLTSLSFGEVATACLVMTIIDLGKMKKDATDGKCVYVEQLWTMRR